MAVINGTALLLSSEGVNIALQRGLSLGVNLNLDDATNKESAGWANHISGMLNASIDFDALFSASATPLMSAKDLMDYILNRESLLISILGLGYPIVGEADMSSLKFNAPLEQAMSLSGSLKVNGQLFVLSGAKEFGTGKMTNLLTDPGGISQDYDTLTISGTTITTAINIATGATAVSNNFSVINGNVLKLITYVSPIYSGQLPTITIQEYGVTSLSNVVQLTSGLNVVTLTIINAASANASASLVISNSAAANWSTSPIYLFKI